MNFLKIGIKPVEILLAVELNVNHNGIIYWLDPKLKPDLIIVTSIDDIQIELKLIKVNDLATYQTNK